MLEPYGAKSTNSTPNGRSPYRCRDCRRHYSFKTTTPKHDLKLPSQTRLLGPFLIVSNTKGHGSVQLAVDLGITQKSPCHLSSQVRQVLAEGILPNIDDSIEVDGSEPVGGRCPTRGWAPRSPSDSNSLFDVGWIAADAAWIAEVKSLTATNEERQLRLGLGQVLSYAHLVDWGFKNNHPVLAVEREPSPEYWPDLCQSHGVALSWPEVFDELLDSCV